MTRKIAIVSGKGGVGKSATAANLGIALAQFGKDVTVVDANFTTPDLSLHFGSPIGTPTLHHVITGDFRLEDAIHVHPSGLKIIPASIAIGDMKRTRYSKHRLDRIIDRITGDFVLLDTQAGLSNEVQMVMASADEVLVVTNPEWPAITDALKTILIAKEHGAKVTGVVLNRVTNQKIEPSLKGVESILETEIIGVVPEDIHIKQSIATKNPVIIYEPNSDAAIAFKEIAAKIAGVNYKPPHKYKRKFKLMLKNLFG